MKFHSTPITTTEMTFGIKKIARKKPEPFRLNLVNATAKNVARIIIPITLPTTRK
ncbi:hypothetical protein D3C86_2174350 [compost metagenome]